MYNDEGAPRDEHDRINRMIISLAVCTVRSYIVPRDQTNEIGLLHHNRVN